MTEAKRLEAIVIRLKKEALELIEDNIRFAKWLADNCELGIHSESKHYLHFENRVIEVTIEQAYKIFKGEVVL